MTDRMKRILTVIVLCFMQMLPLCAGILTDAASGKDIRANLVLDRKWVPYPDYHDRAGWDALLGEYRGAVIAQGEKYLHNDWLVVRATDYLEYNRSGNRMAQESRIRHNAEALACLMLAELAEGKGRFMDDILDGAFLFCESTSWVLVDHLYKFQKVQSPIPDYKDEVLALYQGNFSQMMAWIYYFFNKEFDKEDPAFSPRIKYELQRRELDPYLERDDFSWMGFTPGIIPNNWNPWNNSNAIVCFMLMEDDPDVLARAVAKSIRSVDSYLSSCRPDGACDEGTVYWYKSAGNLMNYLECLSLITGGTIQIWDNELFRNFGEYIVHANIHDKWQANFADASPITHPIVPTIYRYAKATGSTLMMDYVVHASRENPYDPVDVDWCTFFSSLQNLVSCAEVASLPDRGFKHRDFVFYPDTQLCYIRRGAGYLAAKGGNNKERHNHNDVGTIIYYHDNQPVLIDAGAGTYNKSTFDKKLRYKIWNMSSNYHNVPQINGYAQEYGAQFKAAGTTASRRKYSFTADIAGAYPSEAGVRSWIADYSLAKDGALKIKYSYDVTPSDQPTQLHFLVPSEPAEAAPGRIALGGGVYMKYDAALLSISFEKIPLEGTGVTQICGDAFYRISLQLKKPASKGDIYLTVSR